jgi:hypothetical protein
MAAQMDDSQPIRGKGALAPQTEVAQAFNGTYK